MPKNTRPKRTPIGASLPPELALRLQAEADARVLAPSVLIEKSLRLLFASFDAPPMPNGEPEPLEKHADKSAPKDEITT